MNKKGQMILVRMMVAIMVFIATTVLIEPLKESITDARGAVNLDCGNAANSVFTKATCILVDSWLFNFVGASIFAGIAYITTRKKFAGQ